jgi:hypothetical protein
VRELSDADAYMELVRCNTQGELHPLEEGLHALGSGLTQRDYAEQTGKSPADVQRKQQAAKVLKSCIHMDAGDLRSRWRCLAEIHAAPSWLWPALAVELVARGWTVEVTRGKVAALKDAPRPPEWADGAIATAILAGFMKLDVRPHLARAVAARPARVPVLFRQPQR